MDIKELQLKQIALEKQMTQGSIDKFQRALNKAKQENTFGNTQTGSVILSNILQSFINAVEEYMSHYSKGHAVKSTIAASIIKQIGVDSCCYIAAKTILNHLNTTATVQFIYRQIGQNLEDEFKMRKYHNANKFYYDSIQKDLNSRGAKAQRKKYITMNMFKDRLEFHVNKWSITEKVQTGMLLTSLFVESTGMASFETVFKGKKQLRVLVPTKILLEITENINNKLEVTAPFFLPMICPPKDWKDIFDGGYLSPYLKRNKVIKNNDRVYLEKLKTWGCNKAFKALNIIQATPWQINKEVLEVLSELWKEGKATAGLPQRDDEPLMPYPYPEKQKEDFYTEQEKEIVKKWKRETYEIHKRNVANRSIRLLTSQILRIAHQFETYDEIYFPYQLDFRGRMYPIPVLLHPQGSDVAKGLLRFAEGKPLLSQEAQDWFFIHGANMWGEDKCSYQDRVKFIKENKERFMQMGKSPLENRGWVEADKPIQFLAWCIEFYKFNTEKYFESQLAVQLDGTCNGLQHYSALLRDEVAGKAVNLINQQKPSDIYEKVADKLKEKLNALLSQRNINDISNVKLAHTWLTLGINRKLTKRPVMVLPYGGSRLSCREYIEEYLKDNYSSMFIWENFKIGNNPTDCAYKASLWLSHYLWEAITDTLKSAIVGMDYIKALARSTLKYQDYLEWTTPMGLLIHQAYQKTKIKEIRTELFGKVVKTNFLTTKESIDKQAQLNGICPNFIHSLDAACLMLWLSKCRTKGIKSFMSVHDCYGVHAADTALSAKLLREAFVEVYTRPILDDFEADLIETLPDDAELPEKPKQGNLHLEDVLNSNYFFN